MGAARQLPPESYRLTFPGCPTSVSIHLSLLPRLRELAANLAGDQQGLLHGPQTAAGAEIVAESGIARFDEASFQGAIENTKSRVLGYYHVRKGDALELSDDELELGNKFFSTPGSVILLILRGPGVPKANFFFREGPSFLNLPLLPFNLGAAKPGQFQPALPALEESPIAASPCLEAALAAAALPSGQFRAPARPPASRARIAGVVAVIVLLAGAAVTWRYWKFDGAAPIDRPMSPAVAPNAGISLRAERQGEDLKIIWNQDVPAIAKATSGVLTIEDGGNVRRIELTSSQIRFGSLLYSATSNEISFHLGVLDGSGNTAEASLLALLKHAPVGPSTPAGQRPPIPFEVRNTPLPPKRSPAAPAQEASGATAETKSETSSAASQSDANPEPIRRTAEEIHASAPTAPPTPAQKRQEPSSAVHQEDQASVPGVREPITLPAQAPAPTQPQAAVAESHRPDSKVEKAIEPPVLKTTTGARTPPELRPLISQPVTVTVEVDVDERGRVTTARAIPEKGVHSLLLAAAMDAARACRFAPARQGGKSIPGKATLRFKFAGR